MIQGFSNTNQVCSLALNGGIMGKISLLDKTFNKKLLSKSTLFSLKHLRATSYPLTWTLLPVQMRTVQHNTSQSKPTLLAHQHHPATTANLLQTSFHPGPQSFVLHHFTTPLQSFVLQTATPPLPPQCPSTLNSSSKHKTPLCED